eukprot:gb/GECG01005310.1/.p1 GENE.gb/GECG01005310.1/~~gb/GECG01005310.1/.p1  ORF type:complete len:1477 (+),score=206.05 gb/GECG01005310.1/:1-4431(+)
MQRVDSDEKRVDTMNPVYSDQDDSPHASSVDALHEGGNSEESDSQNQADRRYIHANKSSKNVGFPDNEVVTSKYTVLNFLFKFLWSKFRYEVANQYFLLICILQSIPAISITGGIPTTAAPLAFVLFVDGFFTAIQDYNRHVADRYVNIYSKVDLIRDGKVHLGISWRDVRVGDIVKVRREERFPCDMLCLGAVHGDTQLGNKHRRCHVNTKDLDGENNLKMRKAIPSAADKLGIDKGEDEEGNTILVARESEEENDRVWCQFKGHVDCEAPNGDLDRFSGKLFIDDSGPGEFLEKDNLLLRSTELRNCSYIYGLAVYTGYETKINFGGGVSTLEKFASLSGNIDYFVLGMFSFQFVICSLGAAMNIVWESSNSESHSYLELPSVDAGNFFLKFFTFFLLMSQLVPISLYVSIKISRQAQKYMMDRDPQMALTPKGVRWVPESILDYMSCRTGRKMLSQHADRSNTEVHNPAFRDSASDITLDVKGSKPETVIHGEDPSILATEVRTMDLNDELGQITHIFSDKTGTLTCNDFQFRQMSIAGRIYGQATTQIGVITSRAKAEGEADIEHVRELEELLEKADSMECPVEKVKFYEDPAIKPTFEEAQKQKDTAEDITYFMYNLALDHTVEIEPTSGSVKYSSASPDEESFAYAVKFFGYEFVREDADVRVLRYTDPQSGESKTLQFRLHALLPFSSARGMMSVIVEDLNVASNHSKKFLLFSKGADNAILEKLYPLPDSPSQDNKTTAKERWLRAETDRHIKEFGADGLRAMAFAMKELDQGTVDTWLQEWSDARSIHDDSEKTKQMAKCMEKMEKDMSLQGATAIEDRLQDEVAETIATLTQANIKIYMLTGDKEETAINIGYGVNMLTSSHDRHILTLGEFQRDGLVPEDVGDLYNYPGDIQAQNPDAQLTGKAMVEKRIFELRLKLTEEVHDAPQALVVDKDALQILLDDPVLSRDLSFVTEKCSAVICCRCRPKQKERMLRLIKENVKGAKCLAIGDGANDVDMINASNVGVGILGAEGSGAANSSDYKIPQFKVLKRLVLVHGRWNYIRMATLIAYMFYKNALFALTQFWYSMFTGWSGQKFYIELATQTFNLIYTGLPILLVAVMDQDIDAENAQLFPRLYHTSQSGNLLNIYIFGIWILSAIYESLVTYFFTEESYFSPDPDGYTPSIFELGTVVFTAVVTIASLRLAGHTSFHYWTFQLILFLSVAVWPLCAFIFDYLDADGMRGGMQRLFGSSTFWFVQVLIPTAALLPVIGYMSLRKMFFPSYQQQVKDAQLFIKPKDKRVEFNSVPECQYSINKCFDNPAVSKWKQKKDELLKVGLELDATEQVDQLQQDIYTFNAQLDHLYNERLRKTPHLYEFRSTPSTKAGISPLSESKKRQIRKGIVAANRKILEQFGKLESSSVDTTSHASAAIVDWDAKKREDSRTRSKQPLARQVSVSDFAHDDQTTEDKASQWDLQSKLNRKRKRQAK